MDRPIRLFAAIPAYGISLIIGLFGLAYVLFGEWNCLKFLVTGRIADAIVWSFIYPVIGGIIGAVAGLFWLLGTTIHGLKNTDNPLFAN